MSESKASRTLLKSPPELWSEVSSATSLQRHMDQFGEIRITKLEPETAVAWEGEHARGTITLEASGWGTKVSLTAEPFALEAGEASEHEAAGQHEPEAGDPVESEPLVDPVESEPIGDLAEPQGLGDSAERLEVLSLDPPHEAVETQTAQRTVFVERDPREMDMRERRWTRRLARSLRAWFSPQPRGDAHAVTSAPEPVPEQPVTFRTPITPVPEQRPVAPVREQPAAAPVPEQPAATSVPEQPEASVAPVAPVVEPALPQHAPHEPETASTAALDAALDSLGQAHHRPFSRA